MSAAALLASCSGKRETDFSRDSITVLYPEDEAVLGPGDDVAAQF